MCNSAVIISAFVRQLPPLILSSVDDFCLSVLLLLLLLLRKTREFCAKASSSKWNIGIVFFLEVPTFFLLILHPLGLHLISSCIAFSCLQPRRQTKCRTRAHHKDISSQWSWDAGMLRHRRTCLCRHMGHKQRNVPPSLAPRSYLLRPADIEFKSGIGLCGGGSVSRNRTAPTLHYCTLYPFVVSLSALTPAIPPSPGPTWALLDGPV